MMPQRNKSFIKSTNWSRPFSALWLEHKLKVARLKQNVSKIENLEG